MEVGRPGRVQVEDLIFLIRKDPRKYSRVKELLMMNEELKKARKAFDEAIYWKRGVRKYLLSEGRLPYLSRNASHFECYPLWYSFWYLILHWRRVLGIHQFGNQRIQWWTCVGCRFYHGMRIRQETWCEIKVIRFSREVWPHIRKLPEWWKCCYKSRYPLLLVHITIPSTMWHFCHKPSLFSHPYWKLICIKFGVQNYLWT